MKTFVSQYLQRTALAMICVTLLLPLCFVYAQERQPDQLPEVRTSDESITQPQAWRPWGSIAGPPGQRSILRPAAAGRATGELDLVDRTLDGEVWHRWWSASTGWRSWEPLGKPQVGTFAGPAIVRRRNGILDIFVIGGDGQVWHKWKSASTESGWGTIGAPPLFFPEEEEAFLFDIAATERPSGVIDVIVTDQYNDADRLVVWHRWWSASTHWSLKWDPLGIFEDFAEGPAVAARGNGVLDVFMSHFGTPYHKWWSASTGWNQWNGLDGIISRPSAVWRPAGYLSLVGKGSDGAIYHKWWGSGSGWSGWEGLGRPYNSGDFEEPIIAALPDGQVFIFVKDRAAQDIYFRRWV